MRRERVTAIFAGLVVLGITAGVVTAVLALTVLAILP